MYQITNSPSAIRALQQLHGANVHVLVKFVADLQQQIPKRDVVRHTGIAHRAKYDRKNLAVGFMFKKLAQKNPAMVMIPLEPPICVDISVWRKKDLYAPHCMKEPENDLQQAGLFEK